MTEVIAELKSNSLIGSRRLSQSYSFPPNELEVLGGNKNAPPRSPRRSPKKMGIIQAIQMEAQRARKRSKSFNLDRTKSIFAQRMGPIMMAQRLKRMALTKRKAHNVNVNVSEIQNSSLGMLEVEKNVEKMEVHNPFDPNVRIDQHKQAFAPVLHSPKTPTSPKNNIGNHGNGLKPNMTNNEKKFRIKCVKLKRINKMFKEKIEKLEKKFLKEKEKKKKILFKFEKANSTSNLQEEELLQKNNSLKRVVLKLQKENKVLRLENNSEDNNNPNGNGNVVSNNDEVVKLKELMEKRKKFFEKKMKQLAKKVIDYEDIIKKIKLKAIEIKKQNMVVLSENKKLEKKSELYEELKRKVRYLKNNYGDFFKKIQMNFDV